MIILAEASNGFMGTLMYALLALIGGAAAAFSIYAIFRKPGKVDVEQPVETRRSPKRFIFEFWEERHTQHKQRLDTHDKELEKLWRSHTDETKRIESEVKTNREHNEQLFNDQTEEIHKMENRLRDKIDGLGSKLIADFKNMMRDK